MTRLGRGVDLSGQLSADAVEDVCAAIGDYMARYEELGADRVIAIATSAVRDAVNGEAFIAELRERFGLDARLLDRRGGGPPHLPGRHRRRGPPTSRPWSSTSAAARPS